MVKILVQIKDQSIFFKIKRKLNGSEKNLLNTNIISDNELVFTDEYIMENTSIVSSFIKELTKTNNINEAIIYNNKIILQIIDVIKNINNINTLILKDDVQVTHKMCEQLINSNIKVLSVYSIPEYLVEFLDKYEIVTEVRTELFFTSNFIESNSLNKYSSLYYKKSINLEFPFNNNDFDDFEAFCNINNYLKVIHINKTIKKDLEELIDILLKYRKKKIKILLHENINDLEIINYIKRINKNTKKNNNITIDVAYSDEYIGRNLLPQFNITILKYILLFIIIIVSSGFIYVIFNNYFALRSDLESKEIIEELIESTPPSDILTELKEDSDEIIINDYIASLMTLNKDTVGYLVVNNTLIKYPVLQTDNNEYYLTNNIHNKYDLNGWIFMDSKSNFDMSSDNTVIFGHTRYSNSIMFGTLDNIMDEEWRSNPDNLIISYDSLYGSYKYQIFSYYETSPTNTYLVGNYKDDFEKVAVFEDLQAKSITPFEYEFKHDDKILTLSTCSGNTKRFVVHAVLMD